MIIEEYPKLEMNIESSSLTSMAAKFRKDNPNRIKGERKVHICKNTWNGELLESGSGVYSFETQV